MKRTLLFAWLMASAFTTVQAQRIYQPLGRGVVVAKDASGYLVTWRKLAQEPENIQYNVYVRRAGGNYTRVNQQPLSKTNLQVPLASLAAGSEVAVTTVYQGKESNFSQPYGLKTFPWNNVVTEINFETSVLNPNDYKAKYVWPADLDGDGEYEFVVDRLTTVGLSERSHKLQAYKTDGTCLWTVDLGPNVNIDSGQNDMVLAYDIDCDGKAEVIIRSSDGTRFWDKSNNTFGKYVFGKDTPDVDGDGIVDYWNSTKRNPPFYASVIDGETGAEKNSAELKYAEATDGTDHWGRDNRADYMGEGYAFMEGHFGIAYFDGVHPSVVMECQTRTTDKNHHTYVFAFNYSFDAQHRATNWHHAATTTGKGASFHQIRIADMDGDGRDEMVQGGYWVNPLTGKYVDAGITHGDRFRVSDIDPERPGLEVYAIQQYALLGQLLWDAETGEHIREWYLSSTGDVGRGECMDVDLSHKGYEIYSTMPNLYDCQGNVLQEGTTDWPHEGVWWDGLLDREVLGSPGGSGWQTNVMINKYGGGRLIQMSRESGWAVNTCTGNRPLFFGDIMGDWREEVILPKQNDQSSTGFVVYSTAIPTDYSIYCLQQDPHYRGDCTTRGYYQSPTTGFYLGGDMPYPPLPPMMVGEVTYASGALTKAWADGKTVLFDLTGQCNEPVQMDADVSPDTLLLMVPKGHDYLFRGGSIAGGGDIWKSQQGEVTIQGDLKTTGTTYVSEGTLCVNGTIAGPVELRAKGTLQGNVTFKDKLTVEGALNYASGRLMPGQGNGSVGTMTFDKGLTLNHRTFIEMDLSETQEQTSDLVQVNGDLSVTDELIFTINLLSGTVQPGEYKLISYMGAFSGSLDEISVRGLTGISYKIEQHDHAIWLRVMEQRQAADHVVWTGATDGVWNYQTNNFLVDGQATAFVSGDAVVFGDEAQNYDINIPEWVPAKSVVISNQTQKYTLQGEGGISGEATVTKEGNGRLDLLTNKSNYTGATYLNGGVTRVTELANGGTASPLGAATSAASNWQMGKATLIVDNLSVSTDRGLTLNDSATMQIPSGSLTLHGVVTGKGTFVKTGAGQVSFVNAANTWTGGTVLQNGTLAMGAWNAGFGKSGSAIDVTGNASIIVFNNNSTSAVPNLNYAVRIAPGKALTIACGQRCIVGGKLTGEGTLKISYPYVRGDFAMNLSAFEGTLQPTSGQFRLTTALNLTHGIFAPGSGVYTAGYRSQSGSETSYTHNIGSLKSDATDASFGTGIWNVGALGQDDTFAGKFNASATLNKVGEGTLTLSGNSECAVNVNAGTLLLGNSTGVATSGTVTVKAGAQLRGTGTTNQVVVNKGATLAAGKQNSLLVGKLTVTGNLTLQDGAILSVRARSTRSVDQFIVGGNVKMTNPVIRLERLSGDWQTSVDYKVFTVDGTMSLIGTPILEPAVPITGYVWDLSSLTDEGIIRIVEDPVGIRGVENDASSSTTTIYDVNGRRVSHPLSHGVYVVGGKKVIR